MILRRAGLALLSLAILGTARAQEAWPQRQVRIIVPVLPGGASDTLTRAVAEKLG